VSAHEPQPDQPRAQDGAWRLNWDLGNADLDYRGDQIRTPNIDKLATEAVRLGVHLWRTGVLAVPRGIDDWPVSHAIRL
jgi:hypothetical protein